MSEHGNGSAPDHTGDPSERNARGLISDTDSEIRDITVIGAGPVG